MIPGSWMLRAETWSGVLTSAVGLGLLTRSNSSLSHLLMEIAPIVAWSAVLILTGLASIMTMIYRIPAWRAVVMLWGSAFWWFLCGLMYMNELNIGVLWIGIPVAVSYSIGFGCAVHFLSNGRGCVE